MTNAPLKPCWRCKRNLTRNTMCDNCKAKTKKKDAKKPLSSKKDPQVKKWLNTARYIKGRKLFLAKNPFCCSVGCNKRSNILDHKIPHKGNERLFWDENNWQPKCKKCHDTKTAKYDGGFGNPVK